MFAPYRRILQWFSGVLALPTTDSLQGLESIRADGQRRRSRSEMIAATRQFDEFAEWHPARPAVAAHARTRRRAASPAALAPPASRAHDDGESVRRQILCSRLRIQREEARIRSVRRKSPRSVRRASSQCRVVRVRAEGWHVSAQRSPRRSDRTQAPSRIVTALFRPLRAGCRSPSTPTP